MSLTNSLTLRSLTHSNLESEKSNIYTENIYVYPHLDLLVYRFKYSFSGGQGGGLKKAISQNLSDKINAWEMQNERPQDSFFLHRKKLFLKIDNFLTQCIAIWRTESGNVCRLPSSQQDSNSGRHVLHAAVRPIDSSWENMHGPPRAVLRIRMTFILIRIRLWGQVPALDPDP